MAKDGDGGPPTTGPEDNKALPALHTLVIDPSENLGDSTAIPDGPDISSADPSSDAEGSASAPKPTGADATSTALLEVDIARVPSSLDIAITQQQLQDHEHHAMSLKDEVEFWKSQAECALQVLQAHVCVEANLRAAEQKAYEREQEIKLCKAQVEKWMAEAESARLARLPLEVQLRDAERSATMHEHQNKHLKTEAGKWKSQAEVAQKALPPLQDRLRLAEEKASDYEHQAAHYKEQFEKWKSHAEIAHETLPFLQHQLRYAEDKASDCEHRTAHYKDQFEKWKSHAEHTRKALPPLEDKLRDLEATAVKYEEKIIWYKEQMKHLKVRAENARQAEHLLKKELRDAANRALDTERQLKSCKEQVEIWKNRAGWKAYTHKRQSKIGAEDFEALKAITDLAGGAAEKRLSLVLTDSSCAKTQEETAEICTVVAQAKTTEVAGLLNPQITGSRRVQFAEPVTLPSPVSPADSPVDEPAGVRITVTEDSAPEPLGTAPPSPALAAAATEGTLLPTDTGSTTANSAATSGAPDASAASDPLEKESMVRSAMAALRKRFGAPAESTTRARRVMSEPVFDEATKAHLRTLSEPPLEHTATAPNDSTNELEKILLGGEAESSTSERAVPKGEKNAERWADHQYIFRARTKLQVKYEQLECLADERLLASGVDFADEEYIGYMFGAIDILQKIQSLAWVSGSHHTLGDDLPVLKFRAQSVLQEVFGGDDSITSSRWAHASNASNTSLRP